MFVHNYSIPHNRYDGLHRYMAAFRKQDPKKIKEIREWCYNTYGPPGLRIETDEIRWQDDVVNGEVVFDRASDLELFLLKWHTG